MEHNKINVLFVCLGNICRSPLGEGIFRHLVDEAGLTQYFNIDSAGTSGYNTGCSPEPLAIKVARERGVVIENLTARKFDKEDLKVWDYIIAMDRSNLINIERVGKVSGKLYLMREFDLEGQGDVPDPYCCGEDSFNEVYDMLERSCRNLLDAIIKEHSLLLKEA